MMQRERPSDVAIQPGLIGNESLVYPMSWLREGSDAIGVFEEVVRINPQINRISYITYSSLSDSYNGYQQGELRWLSRSLVNRQNIERIQEDVKEVTMRFMPHGVNEAVYDFNVLAIGSKVEILGGDERQILMLDFADDCILELYEDFDDEVFCEFEVLQYEYRLPPGYILATDNSYHYWSVGLMNDENWRFYMTKLLSKEELRRKTGGGSVFDAGFLEVSLDRGFAALRLSGMGVQEEKNIDPWIIKVLKD